MLVYQRPNPFEARKKTFFKLIQSNGIMKRYALIERMEVTADMFQREYKKYMESYQGIIKYDEKNTDVFVRYQ